MQPATRCFGDCWLGCWLWDKLELSSFWNNKLADDRGDVPWTSVLQLLVVNRLIDPGSELRIHRQWFLRSAMDELLGVDFAAAGKDRLYRCLDRGLSFKTTMGNVLTLTPPLITTAVQMDDALTILEAAISETGSRGRG